MEIGIGFNRKTQNNNSYHKPQQKQQITLDCPTFLEIKSLFTKKWTPQNTVVLFVCYGTSIAILLI